MMERILTASTVLQWVVVLTNLALTLALVRRVNAESEEHNGPVSGLKPGRPAPDFAAATLSGTPVTLAEYAGRAVAFLFVGTHCPPCRRSLPSYEALAPKAARAGVELVLVSTDEAESTRSFVTELDVQMPILVAPQASNPFMRDYQASGTPSFCLIDAQGTVQAAGYPSLEWGEWKALSASWEATGDATRVAHVVPGGRG